MIKNPTHIVISRTDSIGDVCLTLPLAGILKQKYPEVKISFLGNTYTKPVLETCTQIDEIWDWSELQKMDEASQIDFLQSKNISVFIHVFPRKELAQLAKKAKIPHRIGTSHRLFHWLTCNHLPNFSRKNSDLHESQLNTKLLQPLAISASFSLEELNAKAHFERINTLPSKFTQYFEASRKTVILHPKSQGSAREWAIENYVELAQLLVSKNYSVLFTGTEKEGLLFRHQIPPHPHIHDLSGKMTLSELISLIKEADSLVAASTGPLHLAGLCGIHAIGLFSTKKPTHAGRWQPLGNHVSIIEEKKISEPTKPLAIDIRDVVRVLEEGTL